MPQSYDVPTIMSVVELMALPQSPKGGALNFKCPFCGINKRRYTLNVNAAKNVYHCVRCGTGGGTLDLYGRLRFGTPAEPSNRQSLFRDLMDDLGRSTAVHPQYTRVSVRVENDIEPACDAVLNKTYTALLRLPYLKLQESHRQNLYKRGLDDTAAARNCYASAPEPDELLKAHIRGAFAKQYYDKNNLQSHRMARPELAMSTDDDVIAGMLISHDLLVAGCRLDGVPGFYQIKSGIWCFRYQPGMMIPARNLFGEVTGIQIRRDTALKSGLRYMTVSSKGLPEGVNVKIARAHFATGENGITEDTKVYFTEGPLKADVSLHLLHQMGCRNVAVVAFPGISSTRELPAICEFLKQNGITKVTEAFDMDKLTNPNVTRAAKKIRTACLENGITMTQLTWDREYRAIRELELKSICVDKGIDWKHDADSCRNIENMCEALTQANIPYTRRWNDRTKGLDDFLLTLIKRKNGEPVQESLNIPAPEEALAKEIDYLFQSFSKTMPEGA